MSVRGYKWVVLALLSGAFFFHQADRAPLLMGALSDRYGARGFEIGFGVLGVGYLVGVAALLASFLFTFRRDRVVE